MMKLTVSTTLLLTAVSLATALQHDRHGHRLFHERGKRDSSNVVTVPETVVAYEFDGKMIDESEVCKGIKNGSLAWAPGTVNSPDCDKAKVESPPAPAAPAAPAAPVAVAPSPVATPQTPDSHGNAFLQKPGSGSSSSTSASTSPSEAKASVATDTSKGSSGSSGSVSSSFSGSGKYDASIASNSNTDVEFPDGEVDCGDFPEKYGAIPVDWMGLGGYTGVQHTSIADKIIGNIETAVSSSGSQACSSHGGTDAYCSYACPPGYQKSQWPDQNSGTSVGGLLCGSDNKLHLTNPGLSKNLCIKGTGLVSVVNKLGKNACICRTDYPGEL